MTSRIRSVLLGFALLGLAFAGAATYVHYKLLTDATYVSPCDISARFNCSEVYLSQYGAVAGVPVALGGVFFFIVMLMTVAMTPVRQAAHDQRAQRGGRAVPISGPRGAAVVALAAIGLVSVIYFAGISWFVLKTGCILCMGTYVAAIGLFATAATTGIIPLSEVPTRLGPEVGALAGRPQRRAMWAILVVAFVIGAIRFPNETTAAARAASASAATPTAASASDEEKFDAIWALQPRIDLGIPADGAKVIIVKFNDWQCPSCKAAYYSYKPLLDKYAQTMPGAVKYVTRDYPLSNRCNFNLSQEFHPGACEAAAAVRLAAERGKADDMVTWLFANQPTLTAQSVTTEAETLLGIKDFAREYARVLPDIKRDAADGAALKIEFTPTFYINGVKAQGANGSTLSPEYFDDAIRYEMKRAGGPSSKNPQNP